VNEPKAKDSRHDQKEGDDVVEQSRHHQNENPGDQLDNGLKVGDADVHGQALLLRCLKIARALKTTFIFTHEGRFAPARLRAPNCETGAEAGALLRAPHPARSV
jgi:hypothetical protein